VLFSTLLLVRAGQCETTPDAGMLRFPDVSATQIVFVYAGDLWTVPRDGGMASPLANPPGNEALPKFSPDGNQIAFVGSYEGANDLYVIPTVGGRAVRWTYHPAGEVLCDWTPDGQLLFSTNAVAPLQRMSQLQTVSLDAPLPAPLPVPYGSNGSISTDGKWLAYTPYSRDTRTWKRYRGGMASDIWLFHLEDHRSKQITDFDGTDTMPMWHDQTVYYLSDAGSEHRLNIWSYNTNSGAKTQLTKFTDYDVKWPSIGPGTEGQGEIVFQQGASLYLLDLKTSVSHAVAVSIPGDRPKLRPQVVDVSEQLVADSISPTGKRVAVEARGDIWTLPAKEGAARNLTNTNGIAERDPAWSPDGRWIAYFSDATGEYELTITQSDGKGESKRLTHDGTHWRFTPQWSPDSKQIAFTDKSGTLFLHSLESNETSTVDTEPWANQPSISWSHDSHWLAYDRSEDSANPNTSIWLYDVKEKTTHKLTSGYFADHSPVFDATGDFLYFVSNRNFNEPKYEDVGTSFVYVDTSVVLALPLRADVENPLLPKSDEEVWADESDDDESDDDESDDDESDDDESDDDESDDDESDDDESDDDESDDDESDDDESDDDESDDDESDDDESDDDESDDDESDDDESDDDESDDDESDDDESDDDDDESSLVIEIENAEMRVIPLPIDRGTFGAMVVNDQGHLIYGRVDGEDESIHLFDLSAEKAEEKLVLEGASDFSLSADRKKLLVYLDDEMAIVNAAADQEVSDKISTEGMESVIEPQAEWLQVFTDAWRIERDFFYDPTMHGVDWPAVKDRYQHLLKDATSRNDVSFIIGEMISELNVGHAYYRAGEEGPEVPAADCGLLGCRFIAVDGRYQIQELWQGAVWDTDAINPLAAQGVKEGQYLLSIDGKELTTAISPYQLLRNRVGRLVALKISDDSTPSDDDQEVLVKAMRDDAALRFRDWIETNRKLVDEKSNGRVGYIYVVNTGVEGQNDLFRQFYAQMGKDALLIDDRWNGGGQIPTRFIELLNRPATNLWARRDGRDWRWPPDSHQGPKAMLINGLAGSGGDMFPALFKQAGLGKLIGRRTWGGLVGITGGPDLIDGANVTAPSFAFYELDGTWGIEGHGVDPDIEVIDDPAKMTNGGDPQLEAAIEHLLSELETKSFQSPDRPAYPNRASMGIPESDR
jgi:tricorn protease